MHKVLVVEDDKNIIDLLNIHLSDLLCEVTNIENGSEAVNVALKGSFNLIVLDLMLPGLNGLEICRHIRMHDLSVPILILSARSEEIDKVLGLETGADDYLTKPFSIREFLARVKVIFRRSEAKGIGKSDDDGMLMKFRELEIDRDKRKVTLCNARIDLSPI